MKPKLILHMGMPKTGSTSLQYFLRQNEKALLRQGILYPRVKANSLNHNFLTLPFKEEGVFEPRTYSHVSRSPELELRIFHQALTTIKKKVKKYQPHTVILSSEILFNAVQKTGKHKLLVEYLSEITDDIQPVFYIRKPSDFYKSAVIQMVKASSIIPTPKGIKFRAGIEGMSRAIQSHPIVRKFDKASLLGRSITNDFISLFSEPKLYDFNIKNKNESLSAESMSVIQQFRQHIFPSENDKFNHATNKLLSQLRRVETKLKYQRPSKLRESVKVYVDSSSIDLIWLKDEQGIEFSGIDYALIEATGSEFQVSYLEDIFEVDVVMKNKIISHLISDFLCTPARPNIDELLDKLASVWRRVSR